MPHFHKFSFFDVAFSFFLRRKKGKEERRLHKFFFISFDVLLLTSSFSISIILSIGKYNIYWS